MTFNKGDFIKLNYIGKLEDGTVFDTTYEDVAKEHGIYSENMRYGGDVVVIGAGHLVMGLEEDIMDKDVGYEGEVVIPPEKGFGNWRPELVKMFSITKFENPVEGARVNIEGRIGTITKVIGRRVRVDFNNPLAGKTIIYNYKIEEKVDDDLEKVKGLLQLYLNQDMKIEVSDNVVMIWIPNEMGYDIRWLRMKESLAKQILEWTGIEKVIYAEEYSK